MTLEAWLNWFYLVHHVIESSNWSLVLFWFQCQVKTMKSKVLSTYKCNYHVVGDSLKIFDGLQISFVLNLVFGWTIFLQIEKWVKCHLLLKCGLKTSSYDIWFFCALLGSKFWIFEAFMGYLWVFLILLDLFLISRSYSLIWVFGWCSC